MAQRFVYVKTKSNFTSTEENTYANSIVFIEDSKEIFTHGQYFGISADYAQKIATAESEIDALQEAVSALKTTYAFTTISDGSHTASATATAKTIKFAATGKATVSVSENGVSIGATGTSLSEGTNNGETSVDGSSKKIVKGLNTAAYHPDTYFYTATQGAAALAAAQAAQETADSKVASVKSGSQAIEISGTSTAPTVGLKIDPSGNVTLTQGANGLKAVVPAAAISGVSAEDKILSLSGSELSTTLSIDYESGSKLIRLLGIDNEVIASIDATKFIKDGMVNGVSFNPEDKKLTITFNTDAGTEDIEVDLSDLVDTYTAGNGINISGNSVSINRDASSESFLTVGASGLKLSGVQTAINAAKNAVIGTNADQATANTVYGAKKYADSLASNYATAAQGTKADTALQSIKKGTDGQYVTTTVGTKSGTSQSVAVSVTVQAVSNASTSAKGLAEASDVKNYVDNALKWIELD